MKIDGFLGPSLCLEAGGLISMSLNVPNYQKLISDKTKKRRGTRNRSINYSFVGEPVAGMDGRQTDGQTDGRRKNLVLEERQTDTQRLK
jgi:hypothetical protein